MYTTKLGDKICEATATSSIGLRHICKQLNVPYSTITSWIYNKEHELSKKYAHAKMMQLHHLAEEILEIADDSTNDYMTVVKNGKKHQVQNREAISRSRLRIQARMNLISKLAPILRQDMAVKPGDEQGTFILRRVPYPGEVPGAEYNPSQKHYEEKLREAIAQQELEEEQQAINATENVARANAEKIPSSSPKNTSKPALDDPSTNEYWDAKLAREREEQHAAFEASAKNGSSFVRFNALPL